MPAPHDDIGTSKCQDTLHLTLLGGGRYILGLTAWALLQWPTQIHFKVHYKKLHYNWGHLTKLLLLQCYCLEIWMRRTGSSSQQSWPRCLDEDKFANFRLWKRVTKPIRVPLEGQASRIAIGTLSDVVVFMFQWWVIFLGQALQHLMMKSKKDSDESVLLQSWRVSKWIYVCPQKDKCQESKNLVEFMCLFVILLLSGLIIFFF